MKKRTWKSVSPVRKIGIFLLVAGVGLIVVYALWLPHAPEGHLQWYLVPGALMAFVGLLVSFANDLGDNWDWEWGNR